MLNHVQNQVRNRNYFQPLRRHTGDLYMCVCVWMMQYVSWKVGMVNDSIFLWNHMIAKILEDEFTLSCLLRSFSRISFRSNSSLSSSSMNSLKNNNLLNEHENQTHEVAPKHNLFDKEVRFEDINQNHGWLEHSRNPSGHTVCSWDN